MEWGIVPELWAQNAEQYLAEIPPAVKNQLQRALKEILRWSDQHGRQWTNHNAVWMALHVREKYNALGQHHVHAVILDCNRTAKTFDVWMEWSEDEPKHFIQYWYMASPGSYNPQWHSSEHKRHKDVSKALAKFLRKVAMRAKTSLNMCLRGVREAMPDVTVGEICAVVDSDPGRYGHEKVGDGDMLVWANPRQQYRRHPNDLDHLMDLSNPDRRM